MNKKGLLGWIGVSIFLIIILILLCTWYFIEKPNNEKICEENYKRYDLKFCVNNLKGIKLCDKLNMDLIKVEEHLFSSSNYICVDKNGEIQRI